MGRTLPSIYDGWQAERAELRLLPTAALVREVQDGPPARRMAALSVIHVTELPQELLEDWGAFLDVNLYREALVHFLGGAAAVVKEVEVFSGSRRLGTQHFNLLNEDTAFVLTTKKEGVGAIRDHLVRLLHHTRLNCIQWINLNRHVVEFSTLSKTSAIQ